MSYNVAVVIPPIPKDDSAAWKAVDDIIEQSGPRPAVFEALHAKLTSRFPCISSLTDDEIDNGVWSDGPLINNFGHRAAVLGIVYSRVDEVLPFLIETATGLGFSVFDWATERIHRGVSGGDVPQR
jgi:hypothetical protein